MVVGAGVDAVLVMSVVAAIVDDGARQLHVVRQPRLSVDQAIVSTLSHPQEAGGGQTVVATVVSIRTVLAAMVAGRVLAAIVVGGTCAVVRGSVVMGSVLVLVAAACVVVICWVVESGIAVV